MLALKTKREQLLSEEYVRHIYESSEKAKIKYRQFDFHSYTKGNNFDALKVLVQKAENEIQTYGFFMEDLEKRSVLSMQKGIFRTNCLDSLDRTNVAQSKVGLYALQLCLQKAGFNLEQAYGDDFVKNGIAFMYSDNYLDQL